MKGLSLDNGWLIATDAENTGKKNGWESEIAESAIPACVPSIIQQFFPEYHGTAWYWCRFTPDVSVSGTERVLIKFGGADYFAEVWLNSHPLGSYEGGETPFSFDVTDTLKAGEENLLAVRIINPCDRDIDGLNLMNTPHRNKVIKKRAGSCLNHGGLWYGVNIAVVPAVYIEDNFLIGDIRTGQIDASVALRSAADADCEATLTVAVYENKFSDKLTETCVSVNARSGINEALCKLKVEGHKLWSVDDPNLYRVELTVTTKYGSHTVSVKFGFREFLVKDGFFYLNGKKIFIRSSHSGNAFPIGQMLPVRPEHLQRDFIYAKAAGFNMLRAIAGLFRPEQLDLADEIGLLIYEECYAAWCLGYSQWEKWSTPEEYEAVSAKYPDCPPLGDEQAMLGRWVGATEKMILRDRNHPSVVIWGLLNETKDNGVFRRAVDFLPRARELDPTRFIVLNSGRFDFDISIGSAANPYSTEWERTWGTDGHPELFDTTAPYKWTPDNHHYAHVPIKAEDVEFFRTFGKDSPLPYFLSEFGVGSNFHVIEEYKHFVQHGQRLDLEDSSWLGAQSEAFTADFYRFGLEKLFAFPESLLTESRRINADDRKRVFDLLRSNPKLPGYSLTGLLDHGMCGEGLWSYWRRWKPEMFDAVSDGFEPLRFSLFATDSVRRGVPFTVEAVLANEGVLKSGTYTADFAIISDTGVHFTFTESFELDENAFAVPVMKREITLDIPEGTYRLVASLREGSPAGAYTEFYVYENDGLPTIDAQISYTGMTEGAKQLIESYASGARAYDGGEDGIILVGRCGKEMVAELVKRAEGGAKVFFLERDIFFDDGVLSELKPVINDISIFIDRTDWLYHKEYALSSREIFGFTGDKLSRLTKFGSVFANQAFITNTTPDYPLCPGFVTGYYNAPGAYSSYHAMMGYKFGEGEVYLNSFKLIDNTTHPICERILYNIIKLLAK